MTVTPAGGPRAEGLLLRPFRAQDAPALVEIYRDPALRRFTRTPVTDLDGAARWLAVQDRGRADGTRYSFAVLEGGLLVANVVLKLGGPGAPGAEVGYWTAAAARGRGVAPRALAALTDWAAEAFCAAGPVRLDLFHEGDNEASCRVAEKAGYPFEALVPRLPPQYPLDGHWHSRPAGGGGRRPAGGAGG
ncbi:GNAT family N-acetyltransferase [Kitasatospora sp. NPDC056327]|uniref:GNAT family N-acetyltransferase n=1 Tax=Kitasatospora sp. NPDC056327 TaxID=3345785 RepID=UPI0035DF8D6B